MKLRPEVVRPSWGDFVVMDMMMELAGCLREVGAHAARAVVMM